MKYSRQNKLKGLAESYYDSSSMARGMKKIFEWRKNMGKWKYLVAILSVIGIGAFLYLIYAP
jgi:hypothetical protein